MNLSQVEVIVAIAEAGSISKAAEKLYISQPSVSKTLQRFEQEMGVKIFERTSTGVQLTPVGRRFVASAKDIVKQLDNLEGICKTKSTPVMLEFSLVAMSYHFLQFVIPELYTKFGQNPISINYSEVSLDNIIDMIPRGLAEIGVVSFPSLDLKAITKKAQANGLEYHRLGNLVPYIAVSKKSKKYPASVTTVDFDRLSKMPIVSISPSAPGGETGSEYMQRLFGERFKTSYQEIRTMSTGTMKNIVCNCDGYALVFINGGVYNRFGFFDDLRLISIEGLNLEFELGWIQKANTVRSPLANYFIEMLNDYVEEA